MKQQHLKILRYNTGTDKKAFVQFKDFFDAAIFNATIVAYSGASVADLISMHSRRYIIDPQTHIFQQEFSIFEKNHAATSLFEDNRTEKCPVCGHEKTAHGASMQPELITPTMMKSLSNQLYTNLWSSAAQELRDATHIIFVGYSLPIADFEFRYMLQKNVTSSAKIDVILTPNSNPDLVANNLKDLLPSKRYLDAFPKNKVSFYYEGFGPYFSLSK